MARFLQSGQCWNERRWERTAANSITYLYMRYVQLEVTELRKGTSFRPSSRCNSGREIVAGIDSSGIAVHDPRMHNSLVLEKLQITAASCRSTEASIGSRSQKCQALRGTRPVRCLARPRSHAHAYPCNYLLPENLYMYMLLQPAATGAWNGLAEYAMPKSRPCPSPSISCRRHAHWGTSLAFRVPIVVVVSRPVM
jgi:hypothetical protein